MKRKFAALLAGLMVISGVITGCIGSKKANTDGERMTVTVGYPKADESWTNDEYYKYITDKFNVNIEFKSLSADSWAEKARIWITSGDMPDITYADILFDEYRSFGEQGMVKTLPADLEERYPNLGFSLNMTGLLDYLKLGKDGALYGLPIPLDHYKEYIEDFRKAYAEGKNLSEMMLENEYLYLDGTGFTYRKDWAEQLGIETDYIMDYDDFLDMVRKFKEADLGNVGAENTVGIACDYTEAPNLFITAFNSSYNYFHKDETGKYVCGLLDETTTEGVLAYAEAYRTGLISPDFYTYRTTDLEPLFHSQRSGVLFPYSPSASLCEKFEAANPGLKAEDCLGLAWIRSRDGKVHGRTSASNTYGGYYFNPEIEDEKLEKLLEIADYVSSKEGGPQIRLGVEGKDYKVENGEYIIIRPNGENGEPIALGDMYPSYEFFRNFLNPQFQAGVRHNQYSTEQKNNLMAAKKANELSLLEADAMRAAYSAEDYARFNAQYESNALFAEMATSEGDIEQIWSAKREEIAKAVESVVENMNKALLE